MEILGGGSVAKHAFAHGASQSKDDLLAAFILIEMYCTCYRNPWNKNSIKVCWACFHAVLLTHRNCTVFSVHFEVIWT